MPYVVENWRGQKPTFDVVDAKTGEIVFAAGHKVSARAANKAEKDGLEMLLIPTEEIFGRYSSLDLINESTGEIYVEAGDEVSAENLDKLDKAGIDRLELLDIDHVNTGPWIRNTLEGRQGRGSRPRAVGHLSRHASLASHQRAKPRNRCSPACSSIPIAMTFRPWAASS